MSIDEARQFELVNYGKRCQMAVACRRVQMKRGRVGEAVLIIRGYREGPKYLHTSTVQYLRANQRDQSTKQTGRCMFSYQLKNW